VRVKTAARCSAVPRSLSAAEVFERFAQVTLRKSFVLRGESFYSKLLARLEVSQDFQLVIKSANEHTSIKKKAFEVSSDQDHPGRQSSMGRDDCAALNELDS
jgi:hypothetical protein